MLCHRLRCFRDVRGEDHLRCRAHEHGAAREQLVRDSTYSVDIHPLIHMRIGRRLLRRHVRRGAERDTGRRELFPTGCLAHCLGHTEIRDQRMAATEQDVLGLDVAMDHPVHMRFGQRIDDIANDPHGVANRQLPFLGQLVAQRLPFHVGHDVVEKGGRPVGRSGGRVLGSTRVE